MAGLPVCMAVFDVAAAASWCQRLLLALALVFLACAPSLVFLPYLTPSLPLLPCRWSAVTRAERYRNRLQENGEDTSALGEGGWVGVAGCGAKAHLGGKRIRGRVHCRAAPGWLAVHFLRLPFFPCA